jgi:tagatose 1,6-diphosphate aldolase GatY/KbaY
LKVELKEQKMTDPFKVNQFVQETNVDLLAVTIGNVHGKYILPPDLDFARLKQINEQLSHSSVTKKPALVLHGASGLPKELIQQCKELGIAKFNVNTDVRTAAMNYYQKEFSSASPNKEILSLMKGSTNAMKEIAKEKIRLFSC